MLSFFSKPTAPLWRYCLAALPVALFPSLALVEAVSAIAHSLGVTVPPPPTSSVIAWEMFGGVIASPLVETWLLAGMIALFSGLTSQRWVIAGGTAVLWGTLHGVVAWIWFFGTVWSFFVFAYAYQVWLHRSRRDAFLAAAGIHSLVNLVGLSFYEIQRSA